MDLGTESGEGGYGLVRGGGEGSGFGCVSVSQVTGPVLGEVWAGPGLSQVRLGLVCVLVSQTEISCV